ncbi:hypothetical protein LF1_53750 [Rubripirellula obstinata]|uniref:Uncharacterized protein n=2 Tax=Rubripirellula obstinata TaxID=406547 RepID=A0A5B1C9N4_9BACT|nr:hypothetical protein LF1_53750 [Rubripirellula obstinata]
MRFWRIQQLKADMREHPLSDRESIPYLIAFVLASLLPSLIVFDDLNHWDLASDTGGLVITLAAIVYLFHRNGGSTGKHFLQRYFAIGFVTSIRCLAAFLVFGIANAAFQDGLGILSDVTTMFDFMTIVACHLFLYWRIGIHISQIATWTARTPNSG